MNWTAANSAAPESVKTLFGAKIIPTVAVGAVPSSRHRTLAASDSTTAIVAPVGTVRAVALASVPAVIC